MREEDFYREQQRDQRLMQLESINEQNKAYAPQIREQMHEIQAAMITQTNPSKSLRVVLRGFEGIMIDEDGEERVIGEELMNKHGRSRVASFLLPFVNDATRFGNIREKQAQLICLQTINDITQDIGFFWRDYGIRSETIRDIIIDACLSLIVITLSRAIDGDEKKFFSKVVVESVHASNINRKKEGGGFLDKFKL